MSIPLRKAWRYIPIHPRFWIPGKRHYSSCYPTTNRSCLSCVRSGHCELQELAHELGVDDEGIL
ncbi:MAG: hypothetical protein ACLTDI_13370 [Acutalibacteraceae bacterium]